MKRKGLHIFLTVILLLTFYSGGAVSASGEISSIVLSKNELAMEIGDFHKLTVTAIYTNGKTEDVTIKTEWTSNDTNVASIYAGTVTAKKEGTAVLTASYMGKSEVITTTVTKKIKSLQKNKQNIELRIGGQEQINLTATYTDGTTENVTQDAEWTVADEAIADVTNGLVTGQAAGTTTITAKFGKQTTTIPVNVGIVRRLEADQTQLSLLQKEKVQIVLKAIFPNGDVEDHVADKAVWTTSNEAVADALNGEITAYGPGTATITATYGTKSVSIRVEVDAAKKLTTEKSHLFMRVNQSESIVLKAIYADGSSQDVTTKAEWSSNNEHVAFVKDGKITAASAGEAIITAKYGDRSINITLDIEVPRSLEVNKDTLSLHVGDSENLDLQARFANGDIATITDKAEWTSSNDEIIGVLKGKVTAYKSGRATLTAKYGGKSATVQVDVDIPVVINANPHSVALQVGETESVTVIATYPDGTEKEITNEVEWTSNAPEIAEVRKGLISGISTGAATVTIKYGPRSTKLPVSVGVIQKLSTDQTQLTLKKNETAKLTITAKYLDSKYTDGINKDVTELANWTSSDSKVVEVNKGSVKAVGSGKATLKASFEGKEVSILVEVDVVKSLSADVQALFLEANESKLISLTATDPNGAKIDVTHEAEWKSSSPKTADVQDGLVTGYATGKATITAKYGDKSITIPVEVGIITKLEVDKRFLSIKTGDEETIALIATLSDGRKKNVSDDAEWKSSNYKTADVSNGIVRGVASGKATITAKYNGKSVTIPVEIDVLKYLKTNIVVLEMKKGETRQVKALATYMDGMEADVSIPALWSSSKITIVDVKDGIITAHGKGKARVTVKFAGKQATIEVTVK